MRQRRTTFGRRSIAQDARAERAGQHSSWRVSFALALCFALVLAALHTILADFAWWFALFALVLLVLGGAAIARVFTRKPWIPPLVASAVAVGFLTLVFAAGSAFLFLVPTFESLGVFGELVNAGAESIRTQSVPAEVTTGILFLLCLGIGAIAVFADLLANTWRSPALAGVPLVVVLAIPSAINTALSDGFIFLLAAVGYLILLRAGQPLRQTARSLGLGAAVVCLTILLPLVLPPVQESEATSSNFGGYLTGVNPVLNLGADLRRGLPRTMLTYRSISDAPQYLRLVSLQNFSAKTWAPDDVVVDTENRPTLVAPAPGLADDVKVVDESTWVNVVSLGSPWLPVPYPATRVTGLVGDWYWNADALTFASPNRTANGQVYRVESLGVDPTPAQLEAAGATTPSGFGKYTALPTGLPAIISRTATEVTAGADSNYAKAVALQSYFRNGSFGYSETAPETEGYDGTGMENIAKFLVAKNGYCVHFASAMAVMARTLGIPSRVAVGFLPGEPDGAKIQGQVNYRVTTKNVHSWPELYFENIGWIRFEPTPGRGFVPDYANVATPGVPVPPAVPTATPTPVPSATSTPSAAAAPTDPLDPSSPAAQGSQRQAWLWSVFVLVGMLGLLLVPAGVRVVQRLVRVRRMSSRRKPSSWPLSSTLWRELLQSADDLGLGIPVGATPRQAVAMMARAARLTGADSEALSRIRRTVEAESFSPQSTFVQREAHAQDLQRVLDSLRGAAGLRARLRAALAPPSIWRWMADVLRPAPSRGLATPAS